MGGLCLGHTTWQHSSAPMVCWKPQDFFRMKTWKPSKSIKKDKVIQFTPEWHIYRNHVLKFASFTSVENQIKQHLRLTFVRIWCVSELLATHMTWKLSPSGPPNRSIVLSREKYTAVGSCCLFGRMISLQILSQECNCQFDAMVKTCLWSRKCPHTTALHSPSDGGDFWA